MKETCPVCKRILDEEDMNEHIEAVHNLCAIHETKLDHMGICRYCVEDEDE